MVLMVKLKKPREKAGEGQSSDEETETVNAIPLPAAGTSSQTDEAAQMEHGIHAVDSLGIEPPPGWRPPTLPSTTADPVSCTSGQADGDLDIHGLSEAFQRTGINAGETVDRPSDDVGEQNDVSDPGSDVCSSPSPNVDIYVAPAVLGHRWVRSRSTAYIVERPERLWASLLGVAALTGKLFVPDNVRTPKEGSDLQSTSLSDHLGSLSMQHTRTKTSRGPNQTPFQLLLSRASIALGRPNRGLSTVHANQEEILTVDEIGGPPEFVRAKSDSGSTLTRFWPSTPVSYLSLLETLCQSAPSQEPAPPAPRSSRHVVGVVKEEDGTSVLVDGSHPSEVPDNLPQGDLYLCGVQQRGSHQTKQEYFDSKGWVNDESVPDSAAANIIMSSSDINLPSTPQTADEKTKSESSSDGLSELQWLQDGSLGAIEASLGACCAAVERVSCAASYRSQDSAVLQAIDMANLHQNVLKDLDTRNRSRPATKPKPSKRAFVLARPPGHHCSGARPSGFCWVNNVAVMAAHAYHALNIDRIAVLDFDLHHGGEFTLHCLGRQRQT